MQTQTSAAVAAAAVARAVAVAVAAAPAVPALAAARVATLAALPTLAALAALVACALAAAAAEVFAAKYTAEVTPVKAHLATELATVERAGERAALGPVSVFTDVALCAAACFPAEAAALAQSCSS